MPTWHAELAWLPDRLGGIRERVLIEVAGNRIARLTPDLEPPPRAARLPGLVIPGLANAHSHVFQRALRGHTEISAPSPGSAGYSPDFAGESGGSFWTWREQMYRLAAVIDPDLLHQLARAAYGEMTLAGVTVVAEFHYLHHQPDGIPYDNPNRMGEALIAAAAEAGIRLTLLDTCYLRGGLDGRPLEGAQRRFGDGSAAAWATRAAGLRGRPRVRIGAAIHSVRAVDEESIERVAAWAAEREVPLHVHVSEQPQENEDCLRATGSTPTGLLARAGALGPQTTAVHATHLSSTDIQALGGSGTTICPCPTAERALGDGVGPAAALVAAGSPLSLGSDSHAVIDLFEEARALELDQRLVTGRRGHHTPEALLRAATAGGMAALGWDGAELAPGALADFIALDAGSVRLAGWTRASLLAHVAHAATASDVTDVVVDGRTVVSGRRHQALDDVPALLRDAIGRAMTLAQRSAARRP
ncbi:MAG TPA: formimidoylglutamate deiminase [Candidatus Dormibacteraeota bacterium]|nr:formimidoylglutamate deiminase [Candidatus Dormibacteraeota bacterium]